MNRFTCHNTDGYDTDALLALNAAWEEITSHGAPDDEGDLAVKSMLDHWSEKLLLSYDQGNRGSALVAWFYDP